MPRQLHYVIQTQMCIAKVFLKFETHEWPFYPITNCLDNAHSSECTHTEVFSGPCS